MANLDNTEVMARDRERQFSALAKVIWSTCIVLELLGAALPASASNRVEAWGAGTVNNPSYGNDYGQSIIPANLTNAVMVAGGHWHSLALNADGTLQGWGTNFFSVTNFPNNKYAAIACGYLHSLALETNGTVVAEGNDFYGQTAVPAGLSNVVSIACGFYHSLALKNDGTVVAWGPSTNASSIGTDPDYGQTVVPPGLSNVVAIAGGGWHSLALKADGTVTSWGRNDYLEATVPAGVSNVVAITAGAVDSLALEASGKLVAWGDNTYGQTNIPTSLTNGVVAIASGGWHHLALKSDGTVVAWGAGIGSVPQVDCGQSSVPGGLSNVVRIAAGSINSLVVVGTNPPVTQVRLITSGLRTNSFTVSLPTENGRVYRLEYVNSLTNQNWSALPLQSGTGGSLQLTDPTPAAGKRFYRVSRW